MSNELATQSDQKKQLQAFIDTAVMNDSNLKGKLTMAAAWQMMQLPDSSFGWVPKGGAMPQPMKQLAILAHLQVGAKPGFGHIYFLGNKLYQSADFVRSQAASNPKWVIKGEAVFVPHSVEEKNMYGLAEGDMSCKCLIDVEYKDEVAKLQGDGFIGKDELASNKPGLNNLKNRAMTLKTRAMRDLYSRFYPTNGVPVSDNLDDKEVTDVQYVEQVQVNGELATPESSAVVREEIIAELVVESEKGLVVECLDTLNNLKKDAKEKGIKPKELWDAAGCKTQKEFTEQKIEKIEDGLEAISDFVENYTEKAETKTVNHLELAKNRFREQLSGVEKQGGKPMSILGYNHMNVFDYTEVKKIQDASQTLVAWINKPAEKAEPVQETQSDDDFMNGLDDLGSAPAEEPKAESCPKAKELIQNLFVHDKVKINEKIMSLLKQIDTKTLHKGDAQYIMSSTRIALEKNDFKDLNEFLKSRS